MVCVRNLGGKHVDIHEGMYFGLPGDGSGVFWRPFLNVNGGGVSRGGFLIVGKWYLRVGWEFCSDSSGIGCGGVRIGSGECYEPYLGQFK